MGTSAYRYDDDDDDEFVDYRYKAFTTADNQHNIYDR